MPSALSVILLSLIAVLLGVMIFSPTEPDSLTSTYRDASTQQITELRSWGFSPN